MYSLLIHSLNCSRKCHRMIYLKWKACTSSIVKGSVGVLSINFRMYPSCHVG